MRVVCDDEVGFNLCRDFSLAGIDVCNLKLMNGENIFVERRKEENDK